MKKLLIVLLGLSFCIAHAQSARRLYLAGQRYEALNTVDMALSYYKRCWQKQPKKKYAPLAQTAFYNLSVTTKTRQYDQLKKAIAGNASTLQNSLDELLTFHTISYPHIKSYKTNWPIEDINIFAPDIDAIRHAAAEVIQQRVTKLLQNSNASENSIVGIEQEEKALAVYVRKLNAFIAATAETFDNKNKTDSVLIRVTPKQLASLDSLKAGIWASIKENACNKTSAIVAEAQAAYESQAWRQAYSMATTAKAIFSKYPCIKVSGEQIQMLIDSALAKGTAPVAILPFKDQERLPGFNESLISEIVAKNKDIFIAPLSNVDLKTRVLRTTGTSEILRSTDIAVQVQIASVLGIKYLVTGRLAQEHVDHSGIDRVAQTAYFIKDGPEGKYTSGTTTYYLLQGRRSSSFSMEYELIDVATKTVLFSAVASCNYDTEVNAAESNNAFVNLSNITFVNTYQPVKNAGFLGDVVNVLNVINAHSTPIEIKSWQRYMEALTRNEKAFAPDSEMYNTIRKCMIEKIANHVLREMR